MATTFLRGCVWQRPHSDLIPLDDRELSLPIGATGDRRHHELDELVLGEWRKTKEKYACRRRVVCLKYQRAEILVKGDQQPVVGVGTSQYGLVVDARLCASDLGHVMALLSERRHNR